MASTGRDRRRPHQRSYHPESLEDRRVLDSTTVFNEIMYHPLEGSEVPEWIELHNQMSVDMDLGNWSLRGGIEYTFPRNTIIPGGGYLVIAQSPEAMEATTGYAGALGPFSGNLSNAGEAIELVNLDDRIMDVIQFDDSTDWPIGPDGSGASLAKIRRDAGTADPANWRTSEQVGGTPGIVNFFDDDDSDPVEVTFVGRDTPARIHVPQDDSLGADWRSSSFDDGDWDEVELAIGFDTETTELIAVSNVALGKPVIARSGEYEFLAGFDAQNVTDGSTQDVFSSGAAGSSSYWLGRQGVAQEWFVLDLQSDFDIQELRLRNTHNTQYNDRGTGGFRILASSQIDGSNQLVDPVMLVTGNLSNVNGQNVITPDVFTAANGLNAMTARYLRFETLSANNPGNHVGLNEIEVYAETVQHVDFVPQPIGYWPFDGQFEDASGNNHSGTPVAASFSAEVPAAVGDGQSLQLNGNGYVSVPLNVSELSYTASMWFKTTTGNRGLFAVVDGDLGTGGHDRHIYLAGNDIATRVWSDETVRTFGRNFADGQWHHVAHVFGGSVGGQRIYVDGQLVVSGAKSSSDFNWQNRVNIGFSNDAFNDYFVGLIDEVAIWDEALTQTAILALAQGASPLSVAGIDGFVSTDVESVMHDQNASVYVRSTFDAAPSIYDRLTMEVRYDDGFVAYLNGVQIAAGNAPAAPLWNDSALAPRLDTEVVHAEIIDLTSHLPLLAESGNVLAVHGLNASADDSDFLLSVNLHARVAPFVPVSTELVINEVPSANNADLWLELYSASTDTIDLNGYVLANRRSDVEYQIGAQSIPPQGRLLLTADELAMTVLSGDRLFLYSPGKQAVVDGVVVRQQAQARFPDGRTWLYPRNSTPGDPNLVTLRDEIVINEIMYHRQPEYADPARQIVFAERPEEWVELLNRSQTPVDLGGWRLSEAIEYEFPSGTVLEPGQYLVVANDAASLRQSHPAAWVLGNFSGGLSNAHDRIRLLDDQGNPADEVTYYDDGKWPRYADGGGSSLELRDPWSDNNNGAAWASSDETGRVGWQHFTHRGVAASPVFDPPINFNEFVAGLLDVGEVLLDNIRVIQNPDTAPLDLIQNGTFENDRFGQSALRWRIVGTHERSRVIEDPDNPGNHVLHLIADGTANYLANHAETTLVNNTAVVNGRTYEVSFDAKWVAGSPQVRSELYYNDVAKLTILPTPSVSGTPGAANSTLVANVGPTYTGLKHEPVVPDPGQVVTVTVSAADHDGVTAMTLWYAVNGATWNSVPMQPAAGGNYTADIPGQGAATVVQFYVEGEDGQGAISTFPAAGRESRALIKFDDGAARSGPRHVFRHIMLPADVTRLHTATNILSDQRQGATIVYDESEVFYDVGVRLRGSMFSRQNMSGTGYNVRFQPDELFRGVHDSVTMKTPAKREILVKHLAVQAGIPGVYDDLISLITPSGSGNGIATLSMARHGDVFLESQFEDGLEGTLFKMEGIRVMQRASGAGPEDPKTYYPNIGWMPQFDLTDLGDDKEQYRWSIQINRNRAEDDYGRIIEMMKAFSLSGRQLQQAADNVLDVDQWMRTFALMSLAGIGDVYSQGNPHNLNFYVRPSDNKVLALPWDWDFTFNNATNASLWGNQNIAKLISLSGVRRLFYGHLQDMINTVYNAGYMTYWTDHYGQLAGESYSGHLSYIQQRGSYVLSQLPPQTQFQIGTMAGADFTVDSDRVALQGTGWINVRDIYMAGQAEPLKVLWLNDSVWSIEVPVNVGANHIQLQAVDFQGQPVGSDSVTVTSTAMQPRITETLRITELMYHPVAASEDEIAAGFDDAEEFEFIELQNTGSSPLDLTGVRLAGGVTYAFPAVVLQPGQFALVVEDINAFSVRYPGVQNVLGAWTGALSNGGELIELIGPLGEVIHRFEYRDALGWPQRADGGGSSLEVVDRSAAYDDAGNWRASTRYNGSPNAATTPPLQEVVINEILSHTDVPVVDAIELYNTTSNPIDIGGWYVSDAGDDYRKYRIPEGTALDPQAYLVLDEFDFNAGSGQNPKDFALDGAHGDEVRLLIPDPLGQGAWFGDAVQFGAIANGETYGRWPNGQAIFYPMTANTLGQANSGPRLGAVVISEIMYHPQVDPETGDESSLEFIEVFNTTAQPVNMTNWRVRGGVDFDFEPGTMLPAGQSLLIVAFDPASAENIDRLNQFRTYYGIDPSIPLVGGYAGRLENSGERLTLQRPDDPPLDEPEFVPHLLEDQVVYDDALPWPTTADGQGDSLRRLDAGLWGMAAESWVGGPPSPGRMEAGPPQVISVTVNGGLTDPADLIQGPQPTNWSAQRSEIHSIVVVFSRPVQATADDFTLTNLGVNAPLDPDSVVPVQAGMLSSAANAVTLHFTATQLGQGIYQLGIADTITDEQGRALDGDADGIQGGSFVYQGNRANGFYELGGDFNGDGGVTIFDFPTFAYWFSRNVPIAPAYVDLNGDNGITIFDFPYFSNNFGRSLTDPTPLAAGGSASQAATIMSRSSHLPMADRQATAQSVADRQPASQHALQAALASWDRRPADRARSGDEWTWLAISRHEEAVGEPDPLIGDHALLGEDLESCFD